MAAPRAPAETYPPYPSYDELLAAQQWVRPALNSGQLLFWTLDGPLTSAVSVMPSPSTPDRPLEPYYNQASDNWHPVAWLPITEPKVSSITVHVYQLEEWESAWCDQHWEHTDPDSEEDMQDGVEWTILELHDGTTEPDLLRCCGTMRPRGKNFSVMAKPTVHGEEGFVTVHDFLTVVHPWLIGLKTEILAAKGTLEGHDQSLSNQTELMVNSDGLESLMIERKDEWIDFKRRNPVRVIKISAS
ncbi:hypothetical protein PVAG01_05857 [Phlyctema vagabunda]|uniref:Uncharacterized protein n=1 Tax=Phlyctema vagabunda TaxID=108571 RepID=A0ABR4PFA8_9HELO